MSKVTDLQEYRERKNRRDPSKFIGPRKELGYYADKLQALQELHDRHAPYKIDPIPHIISSIHSIEQDNLRKLCLAKHGVYPIPSGFYGKKE